MYKLPSTTVQTDGLSTATIPVELGQLLQVRLQTSSVGPTVAMKFLKFTLDAIYVGLDPPFLLYFLRICKRTFLRLLRLAPPPAPGCQEQASTVFFSKDSILWWCITQHQTVKRRYSESIRENGIQVGGKLRRLGGWGRELREWKQSVKDMALIN